MIPLKSTQSLYSTRKLSCSNHTKADPLQKIAQMLNITTSNVHKFILNFTWLDSAAPKMVILFSACGLNCWMRGSFVKSKLFSDSPLRKKVTSDLQMTNVSWNTSWWVLHKFQPVCSRWTISHLWVTNTVHSVLWSVSHHCWVQRWTSSHSLLRSINTPHLYFIYFTRGKSRRAFLPANGSYTVRLTRLQRCIERALKWGH